MNCNNVVKVICKKQYSRFLGDSVKDDVRVFDCLENNCNEIAERMRKAGWQVLIEYTDIPAF